MFFWRITKYNPKNRDFNGVYLKEEWTCYSEVGDIICGRVFTFEEYLEIENAYVSAIILFMECNNLENLQVTNLEKNIKLKQDVHLNEEMIALFNEAKEGLILNKDAIKLLARLVLREKLWCKLESKNIFVHFGWDYYMYIGSSSKCKESIRIIHQNELFVEEYESPYLD